MHVIDIMNRTKYTYLGSRFSKILATKTTIRHFYWSKYAGMWTTSYFQRCTGNWSIIVAGVVHNKPYSAGTWYTISFKYVLQHELLYMINADSASHFKLTVSTAKIMYTRSSSIWSHKASYFWHHVWLWYIPYNLSDEQPYLDITVIMHMPQVLINDGCCSCVCHPSVSRWHSYCLLSAW